MNREQKAAAIDEVAARIQDAEAVFAVDYRGLSVKQAADLRRRLGDAGASFRIVKNTLTERAADQAGAEPLKELLEGPTAFTFVRGDAALAAKVLATFRRETQLLAFKGGTLNGNPLTVEQVESISRLPAREVLRGQFVGVLASPLTGLVRGLGSLISGLAVQLRQIEEKGLVGGAAAESAVEEAPAAEAEPPAEETPAEPPAEEPSAEETPAEPPADEPTPPEPPAGEPSAEETPAEPPAEGPPAEDGPPNEAPTEGPPLETAGEETPPPEPESPPEGDVTSDSDDAQTEEG